MKKLISLLLTMVSVFSAFALTACSCSDKDGGENVIQINYWKAGLGDDFFNKIVDEFKKDYPEYDVEVKSKEDFSDFGTKIQLGAKYNHVDLYFGTIPDPSYNIDYLEPLNSVLDEVNAGETKKVGEKIDSYLLDNAKYWDDKYYSLPYGGGICGFVYNNTLIKEVLGENPKMPNTTDELKDLVIDIYEKYGQNRKSFIHFAGGYWNYVQDVWQAQYDGLEGYENFYRLGAAANTIGTKDETPSKDVLTAKDGRYKVLEVFESLLGGGGRHVVAGSNSATHTEAQTKFLNGDAVMMCNGAWLVNEMRGVGATYTDFRVMRTPVISSIVEQLEGDDMEMEDETLSAIIDEIDAGAISSALCSQNNFNRIKEARTLIWQVFSEHGACIPNYATAKEGAKKFVKYYFSDKAQKIFNDTVHIALPFTYDNAENVPDTSSWTNFEKDMYTFANSLTMLGVANGKRSSLFTTGGLMNYPAIENNNTIISVMSRASDYKDAEYVWGEMIKLYNKDWSAYMSNARLA